MKNDRVSQANVSPRHETPKKLHKPLRQDGEIKPEQVVTYGSECDYGSSGGDSSGGSSGGYG
jgi:hypothetical protein